MKNLMKTDYTPNTGIASYTYKNIFMKIVNTF